MGTVKSNAMDINYRGDSVSIFVVEEQRSLAEGKVKAIVTVRTSPNGDIEIVYSGKNIKVKED